jgi:hypothetical protein
MRHFGAAITGASGAAVVLGGYEVLTTQPERAFTLLQAWGPAFLVSIMAMFVGGRFLDGLNSTVRESFGQMASNAKLSAEAAAKTAQALTQLAEQGNHQAEETRRLAIYAAQEFQPLYERMDKQDEALREIVHSVRGVQSMLAKEKATLDEKEREDAHGS